MKPVQIIICKFIISAIILLLVGLSSQIVIAQVPPPPPPPDGGLGNGHDLGGNQGAPGAPIGGGFEILLALGAFYVGKKVYQHKPCKEELDLTDIFSPALKTEHKFK